MNIRGPEAADAQSIAALNRELGYAASVDEMAKRIQMLPAMPQHFAAVAESDGRVVGWVHAERRFSFETGEKAEIVGLVVASAARGTGVGRELVRAAERWAAAQRLNSIVVRSNVVRPESHFFYQRIGYARSKTQHVYAKALDGLPLS